MNKKFFVFLAMIFSAMSLSALPKQKNFQKYCAKNLKNNVIVVGRIEGRGIDVMERLDAFSANRENYDGKIVLNVEYEQELPPVIYRLKEVTDTPNGDYFFAAVPRKHRNFTMEGLNFRLFPKICRIYLWNVPFYYYCSIPESVDFVYAGSYIFDFNKDLTLANAVSVDEFAQVKEMLTNLLGEEPSIIRGEISE